MEDDAGVSRLVELIFDKKSTIPEDMIPQSSIPTDALDEDFSKKMKHVLLIRKYIIYNRWIDTFDNNNRNMLSTHYMYLCHLLYFCLYEHNCNRNIFDSFINVCVLVMNISNETHAKSGIDFCGMNSYIIMVFYRNVLKSCFLAHGGFYGFVEYIRHHKYLEWNWGENDLNLSDFVHSKPGLYAELQKEYDSCRPSDEISDSMKTASACMTEEVLSTTSVELPALLSESDLIKRLDESRKKQLANKADRNKQVDATSTSESLHGDSSSNSVSKTNYVVRQREKIARHENTIQAVIRHNHSNIYRHESKNKQKHIEAEGTLEHLRTSIKYLIEALHECDKE